MVADGGRSLVKIGKPVTVHYTLVTYTYDRLQASEEASCILHAARIRLLPDDRVDMRLGHSPSGPACGMRTIAHFG